MAAKFYIKITSQFTDETKRKVEIGPLASSAIDLETIRAKIKNINNKVADPTNTEYDIFVASWISDNGAPFQKFSEVEINYIDRKEINLDVEN